MNHYPTEMKLKFNELSKQLIRRTKNKTAQDILDEIK